MNKRKTKSLAVIIVLVMAFALFPQTTFATGGTITGIYEDDGFIYWNKVEGAAAYTVECNGKTYSSTSTGYFGSNSGDPWVRVEIMRALFANNTESAGEYDVVINAYDAAGQTNETPEHLIARGTTTYNYTVPAEEPIDAVTITTTMDLEPTNGGPVPTSFADGTFTVTSGSPAKVSLSLSKWQKKNEDESFTDISGGSFTEGVYRFKMQVREDDNDYVLGNPVKISVGGISFSDITDPTIGINTIYGISYSLGYAYSPEIAITGDSSYSITASSEANGTISPSGSFVVSSGASKTFTLTPNEGYDIDCVIIDGTETPANSDGTYTFTNVTSNHTIVAAFKAHVHEGGTATCTTKAICEGCNQPYGDYAEHTYTNACDDACNVCNATRSITHSYVYNNDDTKHWKECSICGVADTKADHNYGADDVCDTCGYDRGHTHSYTVLQYDETQHWYKCSGCDATDTKTNHSGGTATCEAKAVCTICSQPYGELAEHTYENACDTTCNVCGETRSIIHNANPVAQVPATAETTGTEAHYECTVCGELFEDAACTIPTTEADLVIAKLAPTLLEGNNGSYNKGSSTGLTFKSSAALSDLKNVKVDGSVIDEAKYEKASGSTVITLKPSYLDTLAVGAHSLVIESETGSVDANFTIGEAEVIPSDEETPEDELLEEETSEDDSPKTGDSSNVILWAGMLLVTSAAMLVTTRKRKKSNR